MDSPASKPAFAWQPLTPRGVAAFGHASCGRLLAVQMIFALFAAAILVWFLSTAWFPTIAQAITQLPATGEIRGGKLRWDGASPTDLAEGRFLAFTVDLQHEGKARSPAHIQVEFGRSDYQVFSLLGFVQGSYPPDRVMPFNREYLVPWWGAWKPALLGMAALGGVVSLMIIWAVLATAYALPVWIAGFFANRDLSLRGSWCLAGAALMPGALLMSAAVFLYGVGAFGLVELAMLAAVHLAIGWLYLALSVRRLPPVTAAAGVKENPFNTQAPAPK